MNVDTLFEELIAEKVWFEVGLNKLFIQSKDFVFSIDITSIPNDDFESSQPISAFSIGQGGSVIICHHKDGLETWLPVDIWLPDGLRKM